MRQSPHKTVYAQALGINRKNIYRQRVQPAKDEALKAHIEAGHRQHPAYGHRRVALELGINHKRAQRVMAKFNLRPPRRQIKQYSTIATANHPYHNLITDLAITQSHQVWCSDLSAFKYRGQLWYLAMIEDVATRQVVAAKVGKQHDSQLVLDTLTQALATGACPTIFHSDQGTEFRAQRCTDFLQAHAVQISVSAVASPWQNGYSESFFGRFKHEFGALNRFAHDWSTY